MGIFNFLSKKNELKDFFKIDIENIFKYNPQFSHSEKTESGNEVQHYNLQLKELELELFYEIEILKVGENEFNLVFKGKNNTITKDLKALVNFCYKKYGSDSMGNGIIVDSDLADAKNHLFLRLWGEVMISNHYGDNNIGMTLFNIKQTSI